MYQNTTQGICDSQAFQEALGQAGQGGARAARQKRLGKCPRGFEAGERHWICACTTRLSCDVGEQRPGAPGPRPGRNLGHTEEVGSVRPREGTRPDLGARSLIPGASDTLVAASTGGQGTEGQEGGAGGRGAVHVTGLSRASPREQDAAVLRKACWQGWPSAEGALPTRPCCASTPCSLLRTCAGSAQAGVPTGQPPVQTPSRRSSLLDGVCPL